MGIENFDIMHAILDLVQGEYSMLPLLVLIVLECPDPQQWYQSWLASIS